MICPFRTVLVTNYEVMEEELVVVSEEEQFPQCYEGKCPFFEYPNCCTQAQSEG